MTFEPSRLFSVLATIGVLLARGSRFQNWSHVWFPFLADLEPKMDPKMAPKVVQKLVKIWTVFGSLFFEVLGLFKCLLGAFLDLPRLSWTALDPKNIKTF